MAKAICASCQASVETVGSTWKNQKRQVLARIKPHWHSDRDGMKCDARIGVVPN